MSATVLAAPVTVDTSGAHARPGLGRLVLVELRKALDTRAGAWLQVATVVLTVLVVVVRLIVGEPSQHDFPAVLDAGIRPAAVLLPIAGILLVTSEWSQRTGLITFVLTPARSHVLTAKVLASGILALAVLAMVVGIVASGVAVTGGAFTDAASLAGQSSVFLVGGMLTGVGFGAVALASAPAIVALFALPITWTAVATLSVFADAAPWLDTRLALDPMPVAVMGGAQWAHAGTALALWMLLPLAVGTWRITRREIAV